MVPLMAKNCICKFALLFLPFACWVMIYPLLNISPLDQHSSPCYQVKNVLSSTNVRPHDSSTTTQLATNDRPRVFSTTRQSNHLVNTKGARPLLATSLSSIQSESSQQHGLPTWSSPLTNMKKPDSPLSHLKVTMSPPTTDKKQNIKFRLSENLLTEVDRGIPQLHFPETTPSKVKTDDSSLLVTNLHSKLSKNMLGLHTASTNINSRKLEGHPATRRPSRIAKVTKKHHHKSRPSDKRKMNSSWPPSVMEQLHHGPLLSSVATRQRATMTTKTPDTVYQPLRVVNKNSPQPVMEQLHHGPPLSSVATRQRTTMTTKTPDTVYQPSRVVNKKSSLFQSSNRSRARLNSGQLPPAKRKSGVVNRSASLLLPAVGNTDAVTKNSPPNVIKTNISVKRDITEDPNKFHLVTYFFCPLEEKYLQSFPTFMKERDEEIVYSFQQNLNHPLVGSITAFVPTPSCRDHVLQIDFKNKTKLRVLVDRNTTYVNVMRFMSDNYIGKLTIFVNQDIYLGAGFDKIDQKYLRKENLMYALTRHNHPNYTCAGLDTYAHCDAGMDKYDDSHDIFIFVLKSPIPVEHYKFLDKVEQKHFGGENLLIWWFEDKLGFRITNPCKVLITYHHHCKRKDKAERGEHRELILSYAKHFVKGFTTSLL